MFNNYTQKRLKIKTLKQHALFSRHLLDSITFLMDHKF